MKRIFLLIIPLLFMMLNSANGQILRNIARSAANQAKNSAENRATEEVNKEVDKGVNNFIDNLLEEDSTQTSTTDGEKKPVSTPAENSQANVARFMQKMGVETTELPRKDVYKFNAQIVTISESTDYDGKKLASSEFIINFNDKNSDIMFDVSEQGKSTTTIVDEDNHCILVLSDEGGSKSGFATKFDSEAFAQSANAAVKTGVYAEEAEENEDECEMTKTGRSKSISGFKCVEYKCETNNEIEIAWITNDASANNNKMFGHTPWGDTFSRIGFDGMIIQYETKSKTDQSLSIMTVKSIDSKKSSSFSTTDYQISSFSISAE